jgi:hypothetical protein
MPDLKTEKKRQEKLMTILTTYLDVNMIDMYAIMQTLYPGTNFNIPDEYKHLVDNKTKEFSHSTY